ncbi:MAG TPA: hypothetical protein VLV31_03665 [Candidatus Acidoferrales bacterium]|nr:hypothetical protein [Candidatus Acidoferrales bacterium]
MIEINPPVDVKNQLETHPEMQKKIGEAMGNIRPVAAWFTWRYGFIIVEASTTEELNKKVGPLLHLFKADAKVSPTFSLEEFPKMVAALGEEAKKYQYA